MLKPFVALAAFIMFLYGATLPSTSTSQTAAGTPAVVPPEIASQTNPIPPTAEALERVKKMYGYDCAMCHGEKGNGKGELATELKLKIRDFTDPEAMRAVPDGELYYFIKNGKDRMPPEAGRMKDDDLWNMVSFIRTFSKKQ